MADRDARTRDWRIREDQQHRAAVCAWLTANGIDIRRVPADARASIADGQLTIPLLVVNANGRPQIDPNDALAIARETVTVPVIVPPPPTVELWLTPVCPTCGR